MRARPRSRRHAEELGAAARQQPARRRPDAGRRPHQPGFGDVAAVVCEQPGLAGGGAMEPGADVEVRRGVRRRRLVGLHRGGPGEGVDEQQVAAGVGPRVVEGVAGAEAVPLAPLGRPRPRRLQEALGREGTGLEVLPEGDSGAGPRGRSLARPRRRFASLPAPALPASWPRRARGPARARRCAPGPRRWSCPPGSSAPGRTRSAVRRGSVSPREPPRRSAPRRGSGRGSSRGAGSPPRGRRRAARWRRGSRRSVPRSASPRRGWRGSVPRCLRPACPSRSRPSSGSPRRQAISAPARPPARRVRWPEARAVC